MSGKSSENKFQYFDTPDGEDCMKKLLLATKYAGTTGLFASTLDVILYSHPQGYGSILGRYAYITLPFMGIGAAFAATTCAATNIRKKDDVVNYAFGGFAAAAVWGAWKKCYRTGIYGGVALALFSMIIKDSYLNDWNLSYTDKPKIHNSPISIRQDWTLTTDPGRTWKRSVDE